MLITTARSGGIVYWGNAIGIASKIPRWEDLRENHSMIDVEHFFQQGKIQRELYF